MPVGCGPYGAVLPWCGGVGTRGDTVTFEFPHAISHRSHRRFAPGNCALLRGPLVYVERRTRPRNRRSCARKLGRATPLSMQTPGVFSSQAGGRIRTYAPFYLRARRKSTRCTSNGAKDKTIDSQTQSRNASTPAIGSRRRFRSRMPQPSWRASNPPEPLCAFPGETDELRERYAARVEQIAELGTVDAPSLPGSGLPKKHTGPAVRRTAEVTLSWPIENMGPRCPTCSPPSPAISSS